MFIIQKEKGPKLRLNFIRRKAALLEIPPPCVHIA